MGTEVDPSGQGTLLRSLFSIGLTEILRWNNVTAVTKIEAGTLDIAPEVTHPFRYRRSRSDDANQDRTARRAANDD